MKKIFLKKVHAITALSLCFILALGACICGCSSNRVKAISITFPNYADDFSVENVTVELKDRKSLEETINGFSAEIFGNPKLTDYAIVEKLGFEKNDFTVSRTTGQRKYKKITDKTTQWLEIDEFGCFSYTVEYENTGEEYKEYPYTERETMEMGREYLKSIGLWSKDISDEGRGTTTSGTADGVTTISGRGIIFYRKGILGIPVSGNFRMQVEFNIDGKVRFVNYNWREYESSSKAELISLDEAMDRINAGNAMFEYESMPTKLIIERVTLSYWSENNDTDNVVMQPVYIFSGTNVVSGGESETFYITVQANRVTG